jgi:hypothetical protein
MLNLQKSPNPLNNLGKNLTLFNVIYMSRMILKIEKKAMIQWHCFGSLFFFDENPSHDLESQKAKNV